MDTEPSEVHTSSSCRLDSKPLLKVGESSGLPGQLVMEDSPRAFATHPGDRVGVKDREERRWFAMERLVGNRDADAVETHQKLSRAP